MLTPEEIQSREFLVSLRGYDRDEVHAFLARVAEQLAQTEAKAAQLQQRLDRLKSQQPAAAAAAEPGPAAAHPASPEPSAVFAEIGKETQRILEAAQEAGQQIQRKARQEADRDLQAARGQAAKLIAEGERRREHIERIVGELEQARAQMSVQLRGVGRTIEQTLRDLGTEGSSTVREAMQAEVTDRVAQRRAGSAAAAAVPDRSEREAAQPAPEPEPEPEAGQQHEPQPEPEPEPEAAPEAEATPAPVADEDSDAAAPAAVQTDVADETAATTADESAPAAETSPQPESLDTDTQAEQPAAPAPAADEASAPSDAPVQPQLTPDSPDDAEVAAAPAPAAADSATEPAMPPSEPPSAPTGASDPQGLRAAALSPLHPKLVRKVKRELQEIQNIALDTVRRTKGEGEVEDFLPDEEDTMGLGEGAADLLEEAWRAGVDAAAVLAERDMSDPGEPPGLADDFLSDAADRVRSGLSTTLRMGLSSEEGAQALSDRIGAVFAEFKGAQAEELAATHLIRAYEQGLLNAWSASGISARRWVLGREPRCPEGRCRYNDQGGDVAVGDSFPSGHDVPPVHIGCTCTTVPADGSSA